MKLIVTCQEEKRYKVVLSYTDSYNPSIYEHGGELDEAELNYTKRQLHNAAQLWSERAVLLRVRRQIKG